MIDERNSPFFPDFPKQVQHSTIRPTANNAVIVKFPAQKAHQLVGFFVGQNQRYEPSGSRASVQWR